MSMIKLLETTLENAKKVEKQKTIDKLLVEKEKYESCIELKLERVQQLQKLYNHECRMLIEACEDSSGSSGLEGLECDLKQSEKLKHSMQMNCFARLASIFYICPGSTRKPEWWTGTVISYDDVISTTSGASLPTDKYSFDNFQALGASICDKTPRYCGRVPHYPGVLLLSHDNVEESNAAIYFAAKLIMYTASYLSIPLPHDILLCGNRSFISDSMGCWYPLFILKGESKVSLSSDGSSLRSAVSPYEEVNPKATSSSDGKSDSSRVIMDSFSRFAHHPHSSIPTSSTHSSHSRSHSSHSVHSGSDAGYTRKKDGKGLHSFSIPLSSMGLLLLSRNLDTIMIQRHLETRAYDGIIGALGRLFMCDLLMAKGV
ncbi:hypothetical protein ADUPG1_000514 [Aduncisulcus paluster]|uniref:Uncharacterized protein n=1 Tax=Aduncisulcus paluster TaxID=2918883 RepID=A0ABQ5KAL4_9EUKA|nr:hypothetical protein ADUPG1_000514 [Aduncisulcus paluster]